jgi:hypothetical protein
MGHDILIQTVYTPILASMHNFWNDEIPLVHHCAWQRLWPVERASGRPQNALELTRPNGSASAVSQMLMFVGVVCCFG